MPAELPRGAERKQPLHRRLEPRAAIDEKVESLLDHGDEVQPIGPRDRLEAKSHIRRPFGHRQNGIDLAAGRCAEG